MKSILGLKQQHVARRRTFQKSKAPKSAVHAPGAGAERAFPTKHTSRGTRGRFQSKGPERELVTLGWDPDGAALEQPTTVKGSKFYNQQFQIVHSKLIYSTQIKGSDFGL